jgi:hypothetical protein
MQEITNFTHPIELSNEELDLVAAGWAKQQPCGCEGARNTDSFNGNNNGNGNEGLIVVSGNLNGNTIVL